MKSTYNQFPEIVSSRITEKEKQTIKEIARRKRISTSELLRNEIYKIITSFKNI